MDLDRLHGVVEKKLFGRQAGKTFASLVEVLQTTDFCEAGEVAFYVASTMAAAEHAKKLSKLVADELGFHWESKGRFAVLIDGKLEIRFINVERAKTALRGVRDTKRVFDNHMGEPIWGLR